MDVTHDDLPIGPEDKSRYDRLLDRIGSSKMPLGISDDDLVPRDYPKTCYKIINNEIDESLSRRNGGLENKLIYNNYLTFYIEMDLPQCLLLAGLFIQPEMKIK